MNFETTIRSLDLTENLDQELYKMLMDYKKFRKGKLKNRGITRFENDSLYLGYYHEELDNSLMLKIASDKKLRNHVLLNITGNKEAYITGISKENKTNKNFDSRKLINMVIKICKKIRIGRILLTDNATFDCNGKKLSLSFFYLIKYGEPWYSYNFNFIVKDKVERKKLEESKEILEKLTVVDVMEKIPEFEEYIVLNTNEINENLTFRSFFNQRTMTGKLTKEHCNILARYNIFNKIIEKFNLLNLHGRTYKLNLI